MVVSILLGFTRLGNRNQAAWSWFMARCRGSQGGGPEIRIMVSRLRTTPSRDSESGIMETRSILRRCRLALAGSDPAGPGLTVARSRRDRQGGTVSNSGPSRSRGPGLGPSRLLARGRLRDNTAGQVIIDCPGDWTRPGLQWSAGALGRGRRVTISWYH